VERVLHQRFAIPSQDGYPLRGDVRYLESLPDEQPSARAVVVCHGFKGFKDWGFFPELNRELALAGYLAVGFNFSGSGVGTDLERFDDLERFKHATLSGDLDDLGRILDALVEHRLPGPPADGPFGLVGHSRGGAVSLLRAVADDRVGCLVTWASVSTFKRWDAEILRGWRERGYVEVVNARTGQTFQLGTEFLDDYEAHAGGRLNLEAAARGLPIPHLIVHGTADESVPVSEAHELASWGRGELHLIPGAGHTFGIVHPFAGRTPEFDNALGTTLDFLRAHIITSESSPSRGGRL
jgi:pimeloyl-ACP methyl ester carboxylesterase